MIEDYTPDIFIFQRNSMGISYKFLKNIRIPGTKRIVIVSIDHARHRYNENFIKFQHLQYHCKIFIKGHTLVKMADRQSCIFRE